MRRTQCDFAADHLLSPFVCKTHDRFDASVLGRRARRALYLVRDPRDVAISLCHHSSIPLDHAIRHMLDTSIHSNRPMQIRYPLGDWAGHVSGWTEQDVVKTKVVRYEDLLLDTPATLLSAIAFLGGQVSDAEIHRAVTHSSLEELQRQEAAAGFRESLPGQQRFFRNGRVGEWRELMTPTQIRALEEGFLPIMERWGYCSAL